MGMILYIISDRLREELITETVQLSPPASGTSMTEMKRARFTDQYRNRWLVSFVT